MRLIKLLLVLLICLSLSIDVYAHPGRTDSAGGHTDHSTGQYHYHHGEPPHQHTDKNGDGILECPYGYEGKSKSSNSSTPSSKSFNSAMSVYEDYLKAKQKQSITDQNNITNNTSEDGLTDAHKKSTNNATSSKSTKTDSTSKNRNGSDAYYAIILGICFLVYGVPLLIDKLR